eukprot:TRINITY_DN1407_c0_g1_i1.p1 TRINITY_DN1407_c0_g1~~TRINITY_DN1407_c0_g1_i1.p1  ORF type:complete len:136 (+),score=18.64 TRINITY_DN1407_c0_g1_i1:249-656(+)
MQSMIRLFSSTSSTLLPRASLPFARSSPYLRNGIITFTQKMYYSKQLHGFPPEQVADWTPKQVVKWLNENVSSIEPATVEAFLMQDVSGYYLRRLTPNKLFRVIIGQDPNEESSIHDIITETLLFTTEDYTMRKK